MASPAVAGLDLAAGRSLAGARGLFARPPSPRGRLFVAQPMWPRILPADSPDVSGSNSSCANSPWSRDWSPWPALGLERSMKTSFPAAAIFTY